MPGNRYPVRNGNLSIVEVDREKHGGESGG